MQNSIAKRSMKLITVYSFRARLPDAHFKVYLGQRFKDLKDNTLFKRWKARETIDLVVGSDLM